jgi:hypothetical protein
VVSAGGTRCTSRNTDRIDAFQGIGGKRLLLMMAVAVIYGAIVGKMAIEHSSPYFRDPVFCAVTSVCADRLWMEGMR